MRKAIAIIEQIRKHKKINALYEKINPILFDVSLRDGIQSMDRMDSREKLLNFNKIITNMEPRKIEVGSLVSNKILPIMSDTPEIYKECIRKISFINEEKRFTECKELEIPDIYVLIPVKERRIDEAKKIDVQNISIMSSVSESFMKKNTNMSINDVKEGLKMLDWASNIKVYLSCVNECPIEGIIDNNKVIDEIIYYANNHKKYKINELCLSDTCGTLKFDDYKYILDRCIEKQIPMQLLSLHLHVDDTVELEKIIRYSLLNNINCFDVSSLEEGGCSVTIKKPKKNLSYDLFYDILLRYMLDLLIGEPPEGKVGGKYLIRGQKMKTNLKKNYLKKISNNSI